MELKELCRHLLLLSLSLCLLSESVNAHKRKSATAEKETDSLSSVSGDSSYVDETEEPRPPHDPTQVTVSEGQLRGVMEVAHNGKEFYSFRGIPYAAPPVGELRFQATQKSEPWEGIRNADKDPPHCPQMSDDNTLTGSKFDLTGQEDCLYLNVFSPMYEVKPNEPLLPVMVYIHGGAFFLGHADQYQPYILMSKDIILVVIQYRIGTLGFLSTEDSVVPGNMGLKDQTFALEWIQMNVPNFGGDPLRVTIFGQSAGAASVHQLMLTHTSLGLFQRGIMQSGTMIAPWSLAHNHRDVAYSIAARLGCARLAGAEITRNCSTLIDNQGNHEKCLVDNMPSAKIVECLREAPVDVLTESSLWFNNFGLLPLVMVPRVDDDVLVRDPVILMKEGHFKRIDIMMGTNKDEGAIASMMMYSNEGLMSEFKEHFEELAPIALDFGPGDTAHLNQAITIFDRYVQGRNFGRENADGITAMFGDRMNWYPQDVTAFVHSEDRKSRIKKKRSYVYEFSYRGNHSVNDAYGFTIGKHWVTHGDELIYLFGVPGEGFGNFRGPMTTDEDQQMSDLMVELWTNFAETGNPAPDNEPTTWQPFRAAQPHVLIIDRQPHMSEPDTKSQIREFWRQLPLKANLILFPESVNLAAATEAAANTGDVSKTTGMEPEAIKEEL